MRIMKHKLSFIGLFIIIAIILFPKDSFTADKYSLVYPSGKTTIIYSKNFNNKDYISLSKIKNLLFRRHTFSSGRNEISGKSFRFKASQGSFYLLYEQAKDTRIAQMTAPAISVANVLYLPLRSFFKSLPTLGLYYTEIRGSKIILKKDKTIESIASNIYEGTFDDFQIDESNDGFDDDFQIIEDIRYNIEAEDDFDNHLIDESNHGFDNDFQIIEDNNRDYSFVEPSLKFSFLHSANYLRSGFKSISMINLKVKNKTVSKVRENRSCKNSNTHIEKFLEDKVTPKEIRFTKRKPAPPPNIYVLPENLIRRELGDVK